MASDIDVKFPQWKPTVKRDVSDAGDDSDLLAAYAVSVMDTNISVYPARLFLAEWRDHRGLTQDTLAERMQTTKGTISKKESNWQKVDVEWLGRFAAGLNVEPSRLLIHPDAEAPQIVGEDAILAMLRRIKGLSERDIGIVMRVVENALTANSGGS